MDESGLKKMVYRNDWRMDSHSLLSQVVSKSNRNHNNCRTPKDFLVRLIIWLVAFDGMSEGVYKLQFAIYNI